MATRKEQAVVDLVINGRAAETSIKSIQKATFETEKLLRNMSKAADPAAYAKLQKELITLKTTMNGMNAELRVAESSWSKFKTNIGQIALGTLGGNVFTAIGAAAVSGFSRAIDKTYELADAISDVKKSTGLARDEVDELFDSFGDMNTRTTRKELQDLAHQAGKLGEDTLEGAQGFVRGADIINVALKDDLGGNAEEAINKLGKLIEIFDLKKEFGIEKSFVKVGSVINELGGNSAASEEYIVNFTTRLAGIAPAAKISIAEVMGLAAVMDEQGQSTELAATNIGKMLISMGKDLPYFAKVAGMSVKEFTTLLNTNANEALLRVVERAKQSEGGLGNLAKTFTTLGIEGSEGAAVIGALANNIGRVREQQAVANQEFANGTSILNEYNEKNNNTAAIIDKIGRKLAGFWSWVSGGLDPLIRFFGDLFGVIDRNAEAVSSLVAESGKLSGKEKALEPLIKKYNDLVFQAAQGRDVNKELTGVIDQIAKIMPSAVTQVDAYGRAIDISTGKVAEMLKYQRELFEINKKTTLGSLKTELDILNKEFDLAKKRFNSGVMVDNSTLGTLRNVFSGNAGKLPTRAISDKDRKEQLERLAEMEERQRRLNDQIATLENPIVAPTKTNNSPTNTLGTFTGSGKTEKNTAKKEVDEFKQLKDELLKLRQDAVLDAMTTAEREVQIVKFKYDRLRELAKGNTEYIKQLNELEDAEILRLRGEQADKQAEQLKKTNDEYAKGLEEAKKKSDELAAKRSETLQAIDEYAATEQARELGAVDRRFQTLLAQAEEVNLTAQETLPLWEAYWASRQAIEDKYYAEATEKSNKQRRQEIEAQGQLMSNVGDIFASFFEIAASNETEFAEFKKIATLVQLAADTASAISSIVAKGALTSATPLDAALRITAGIAVVMANIAKAKQVLTKAEDLKKPNIQRMPGRETGGFTDLASLYISNHSPQGYINRPTLFDLGPRSWIGGEGYKKEYVFSNAMLQNPVMANFAAMSEALRTSGYDFSKQADMKEPAGGSSPSMGALEGMIGQLIEEQRATRQAVQQFAQKPWNYRRIEETAELLDYIRTDSKA